MVVILSFCIEKYLANPVVNCGLKIAYILSVECIRECDVSTNYPDVSLVISNGRRRVGNSMSKSIIFEKVGLETLDLIITEGRVLGVRNKVYEEFSPLHHPSNDWVVFIVPANEAESIELMNVKMDSSVSVSNERCQACAMVNMPVSDIDMDILDLLCSLQHCFQPSKKSRRASINQVSFIELFVGP